MNKLILILTAGAAMLPAQTSINGGRSILGAWDASGASTTKSVKMGTLANTPATCSQGELYWAIDGQKARKLFLCEAADTWVQAGYTQGTAAPANCGVGEVFFDTSASAGANLMLCGATNTWTRVSGGGSVAARDNLQGSATLDFWPADPRVFWLKEEFVGGSTNNAYGETGWTATNLNGAATVAKVGGSWPNVGLMTVSTGAATGNAASLQCTGSSAGWGAFVANSDKPWEFIYVFAVNRTSAIGVRVGLTGDTSSKLPSVNRLWFGVRYDSVLATPDSTFRFAWSYGATEVEVDSGVPADTGYHSLRIFSDAVTANKVYLQLDGGTARTICNSGCDITSAGSAWHQSNLGPVLQVETGSTTAATLSLDFFAVKARLGSNTLRRN